MAEKRGVDDRTEPRQGQGSERASERSRQLTARREPFSAIGFGPFAMMRRMQEDIDRLFEGFGRDPGWLSPFGEPERGDWRPAVDVFQRGDELIVRVDVPGMSREDLSVEVADETLTVRGERKYDHDEERDGILRSERAYGSFYRVVPLPEGTVAESAKAQFTNGVLEVVFQAPPQETRRVRRIEIGEGRSGT